MELQVASGKSEVAKMSIFSRSSAARQGHSTFSQPSNGILVHMYGDVNCSDDDQTLIIQDFGEKFYAEQLCYMAVKNLELTPSVAPLFALAHHSLESWSPPNETVPCTEDCAREFVLRVRFIPSEKEINRLSSADNRMFNYLFQQIRSDFINDRIVYHGQLINQEHQLGLGVIDMVRYGKQHDIDLSDLRNLPPQDFIPVCAKNNFKKFLDKHRLSLNFKRHLEKEYKQYETDTVVSAQLTYIQSILRNAEHYGMETFEVLMVKDSCDDCKAEVNVKLHDDKFPGLNIYERKVIQTLAFLPK